MSITLLHATLKTFNEGYRYPDHEPNQQELVLLDDSEKEITEEEPNNFSPGPYIIGSLVPRCFDTSRRVQSTALACLQLLVSFFMMHLYGIS